MRDLLPYPTSLRNRPPKFKVRSGENPGPAVQRKVPLAIGQRMTLRGCLRVLLTVGFTVVQFTAVQQPFIAVDIVPLEVIDQCEERPFTGVVRQAKADKGLSAVAFTPLASTLFLEIGKICLPDDIERLLFWLV